MEKFDGLWIVFLIICVYSMSYLLIWNSKTLVARFISLAYSYISSHYIVYINVIDMQISKGCSIVFLSARTIWQLVYNFFLGCTRLMWRWKTTKVRAWDDIVPRSPTLMPIEFPMLVYILIVLGVEMTDWMNLLCCWYMFIINVMRSCNERTTLLCV